MTPKKKEVTSMGENLYKEMKIVAKKFVSQKEGAELYSMGVNTFRNLANDAGAVYKVGKLVLINTEVFEQYLETFRVGIIGAFIEAGKERVKMSITK